MKNHCYSQLTKGVQQLLFFTSWPLSNPPLPNLHLVLCQTQDRRDLLSGVVLSEGLHDVSIEFVKMMLLGVSHRWSFRNFGKKWFLHFMHTYCRRFTLWLLMWRCPWQFCSNAPFVCCCCFCVCVCVCMCCCFSSAWTHRFTQLGEILHVQLFSCTCMNTCLCSIFCQSDLTISRERNQIGLLFSFSESFENWITRRVFDLNVWPGVLLFKLKQDSFLL